MSAMAVAEPSRKGARTPVAMGANVVPYAMARSVVSARGAVGGGVLLGVSPGGAGGGVRGGLFRTACRGGGGGGGGGPGARGLLAPGVMVGWGGGAGYCCPSH